MESMTLVYVQCIVLQFRLAFVAPESRVVGAGDLDDHPKRIAVHYLSSYFFIDIFVVLPLPQVSIYSSSLYFFLINGLEGWACGFLTCKSKRIMKLCIFYLFLV